MMKNIFDDIPKKLSDEFFETLIESKNSRIERIVSKGHQSPENFWYDQKQHEWVIVLKGSAEILFQDHKTVLLGVGDYVNIPAGVKHKVLWTNPDEETIWLAVYYD